MVPGKGEAGNGTDVPVYGDALAAAYVGADTPERGVGPATCGAVLDVTVGLPFCGIGVAAGVLSSVSDDFAF